MIGLAGIHPRLLVGHLTRCGHTPTVCELFGRDFISEGDVLGACLHHGPMLARLEADVRQFGRTPSLSQQGRRRVREVADWLDVIVKEQTCPI